MGDKTGISWANATWNPVVGCSIKSSGCLSCYAMGQANRQLDGNPKTPHYLGTTKVVNGNAVWTGKLGRAPDKIFTQPDRWGKPRLIFVNSMSDLYHENMPQEWVDDAWAVMARNPRHIFQVLTKRPDRMLEDAFKREVLPNVWLGTSVENQGTWKERKDHGSALKALGWMWWISAEPLIGPLVMDGLPAHLLPDWVVVGGESGETIRPMHPDWARAIRAWCEEHNIPFFFKQWGRWLPIFDCDKEDPDWRQVSALDRKPGRWHNLAGGTGFHGERVHRMISVRPDHDQQDILDGKQWHSYPRSEFFDNATSQSDAKLI